MLRDFSVQIVVGKAFAVRNFLSNDLVFIQPIIESVPALLVEFTPALHLSFILLGKVFLARRGDLLVRLRRVFTQDSSSFFRMLDAVLVAQAGGLQECFG